MATSTQLLACVLLLSAVCAQGANTEGRALKTLITKVAAVQPAAVQIVSVPVVSKSISLGAGGLTLSKGGQAAAATSVQQAAEPQPQAQAQTQQPQAQQPQPRQQAPAAAAAPAAAPATAGVSAPAGLPIPRPVPGNSDLGQALQCQSAFNAAGGRPGVENQLGNVCREGNAAFNELGCCQQTAKVLNSGSFRGCTCNNLVYQQLCQEVKVAGLTCANLRGTLIACGLSC